MELLPATCLPGATMWTATDVEELIEPVLPIFDYISSQGVWLDGRLLPAEQLPDCIVEMMMVLGSE